LFVNNNSKLSSQINDFSKKAVAIAIRMLIFVVVSGTMPYSYFQNTQNSFV